MLLFIELTAYPFGQSSGSTMCVFFVCLFVCLPAGRRRWF